MDSSKVLFFIFVCFLELLPVKIALCAGVIKTVDDSVLMKPKPKDKNCLITKCNRFPDPVCALENKSIIRQFASKCEMEIMGCKENKG